MKGTTAFFAVAAAALVSACASSSDAPRVGERVLPDTRAVADHFERAVAMQGPYGFQLPNRPEPASPWPAPVAEPEAPSFWARLWPASTGADSPPAPRPTPAPRRQTGSWSLWDHLWPPLTPTREPAPRAATVAPPRAAARAPTHRPAAANVEVATATAPAATEDGEASGLDEVRGGLFKHAVSFGDGREPGVDLNAEALFRSPGWLAWAYSPRPHLGLTANASSRATDFLYGGLTWEWTFWDPLFVDLGLGLSLHDGMLDNSHIATRARGDRREFGCRMLFRESLELGYRFKERHSLSLMWAHHGNAGLCGDDNDGIDNAGLRYGLRM